MCVIVNQKIPESPVTLTVDGILLASREDESLVVAGLEVDEVDDGDEAKR